MILISVTGAISFCHLKTLIFHFFKSMFSLVLGIFTFHTGDLSFFLNNCVNPDLEYAADNVTAATVALCN